MEPLREHLQTKNYISTTDAYLSSVIIPAFDRIRENGAPQARMYAIDGVYIKICFYVPILESQLARALAHREVTSTQAPDVTIHVADSVTSGVAFPMPWNQPIFMHPQATARHTQQTLGVYLQGEHTLNLYDAAQKTAWFWISDAQTLPAWIIAAPFRTILHWIFSERGTYLVHGAAVAVGTDAVLLTAKGGSGKSTTALACLCTGMQYLADDYVALSRHSREVSSVYSSVKIATNRIQTFPELNVWAETDTQNSLEKRIAFLSELFPQQIQKSAHLRAVLIPRIKPDGPTTIVPTTAAQALLALAPTTIFQLPLASDDTFSNLRTILESLPCAVIELGPDIRAIPGIISEYLASLR